MSKNILNLFFIVATFVIYYIIISPLNTGAGTIWQPDQSIESLRSRNQMYDGALKQADSLYKQAEDLNVQYTKVPDDLKQKINLMVPVGIDPVRLLNEVSKIANDSGIAISKLNYTDNKTNDSYGSYTLNFSVVTTYAKFKEVIHNFETSMRLFTVKSVVFSSSEKDSDMNTFSVTLETYYIK